MKKQRIFTVIVVALVALLLFIGPPAAVSGESNPNIVPFAGDWCRVKVIVPGDSKKPGDRSIRKNQEALWAVDVGNDLVDGYYYASGVHYNLEFTRHNDANDPLYCYGSGIKGLVQGNFTLIPYDFMPADDPPDEPPDAEGSWQGTWHGKYYIDGNGYTWWRLHGEGHGTGVLTGLKILFNGENMRISTMNCVNNIRDGCEGTVVWVPWEFDGYILDPASVDGE